ncbi:MAG: hypothetical protein GF390_01915 [Candidatus Pacebacteria bacterium]|nr:hypothetical protein [Candidatus Paceibacterota bacterium]
MLKKILNLITLFVLLVGLTTQAFAGTNLTVNCPSTGSCSINPPSTPLYQEVGWMPGSTANQYIRMANTAGQDGYAAIEVTNYQELKSLGEVIEIEIRRGSPVGTVIYGGVTLHQFRDDGYFTFDTLDDGETTDYFVIAHMPYDAGNAYQASRVEFDLNMGLELAPIPPDSGGGDGTGDTDDDDGDLCTASAPAEAPALSVSNPTDNTVTLTWTAVSPVTHYALVFTRDSDGAQYGSTNIGNVTSYTVTNLSGGESYSFQVFGINDCMPGPRSNTATIGTVSGAPLPPEVRPLGPGGEVLGVETEAETEPTPSPEPTAGLSAAAGQVAGVESSCGPLKLYIPWILLVLQAIVIFATDYYYRRDSKYTKHVLAGLATVVSIVLFYWLRECQCYAGGGLLAWLCQWYWLVSIVITALLQLFNYAFVEEVEEN